MIQCKTIGRNYLCTHKKYSSHWFLKIQIFSLFPIVKMNANHAEICRGLQKLNILLFPMVKMNANYAEIYRVGKLEAYFQQLPLVHVFSNFHNIVVKQ